MSTQSGAEDAAFNAELYDGSSRAPLVINAGDTIQVHFFVASPSQGWNITVSDLVSATFANGSAARQWAVVSDLGGPTRPACPRPAAGARLVILSSL